MPIHGLITPDLEPSWDNGFRFDPDELEHRELLPDFYWPFYLGPTGVDALDVAGGADGTLTNMDPATDWVVSEGRYALRFSEAQAGYVVLPDAIDDFDADASLVIWLKADNAVPATTGKSGFVKLTEMTSATRNAHYPWTDGKAYLNTFRSVRVDDIVLSATIDRTTWHMVTITNTPGVGGWNFYQNTQLIRTATGEDVIDLNNTEGFWLGRSNNNAFSDIFFEGLIGEAALYRRAITVHEVRQLYQLGRGGLLTPRRRVIVRVTGGTTIHVNPAVAAWSAPPVTLSTTIHPAPATAAWSAPAVSLSTTVDVTPAAATWSAPAVTLSTTIDVSPAAATWSAPAVTTTTGQQINVSPAVATWTAPAVTLSTTIHVSPAVATWTAPAVIVTDGTDPAIGLVIAAKAAYPLTLAAGAAAAGVYVPAQSAHVLSAAAATAA